MHKNNRKQSFLVNPWIAVFFVTISVEKKKKSEANPKYLIYCRYRGTKIDVWSGTLHFSSARPVSFPPCYSHLCSWIDKFCQHAGRMPFFFASFILRRKERKKNIRQLNWWLFRRESNRRQPEFEYQSLRSIYATIYIRVMKSFFSPTGILKFLSVFLFSAIPAQFFQSTFVYRFIVYRYSASSTKSRLNSLSFNCISAFY